MKTIVKYLPRTKKYCEAVVLTKEEYDSQNENNRYFAPFPGTRCPEVFLYDDQKKKYLTHTYYNGILEKEKDYYTICASDLMQDISEIEEFQN